MLADTYIIDRQQHQKTSIELIRTVSRPVILVTTLENNEPQCCNWLVAKGYIAQTHYTVTAPKSLHSDGAKIEVLPPRLLKEHADTVFLRKVDAFGALVPASLNKRPSPPQADDQSVSRNTASTRFREYCMEMGAYSCSKARLQH